MSPNSNFKLESEVILSVAENSKYKIMDTEDTLDSATTSPVTEEEEPQAPPHTSAEAEPSSSSVTDEKSDDVTSLGETTEGYNEFLEILKSAGPTPTQEEKPASPTVSRVVANSAVVNEAIPPNREINESPDVSITLNSIQRRNPSELRAELQDSNMMNSTNTVVSLSLVFF